MSSQYQKIRQQKEELKKQIQEKELLTFGKMKPHNIQFEEAVLGAILLEKGAIDTVVSCLEKGDFYDERHNVIFEACLDLEENKQPIDLLTVNQKLLEKGELKSAGGIAYLATLTNKVASAANLAYHASIVNGLAFKREIISECNHLISSSYDETKSPSKVRELAEQALFKAMKKMGQKKIESFEDTLKKRMVEHADNQTLGAKASLGITTGFTDLDAVTGGFQKGDLICIAARPSMGKSALIKSLAYNQLKEGKKVAIFSLEVDKANISDSLLAMDSCINGRTVSKANTWTSKQEEKIIKSAERLKKFKLYIDDTSNINRSYLSSRVRELKAKYDIDIAYIDYLQIMDIQVSSINNENQAIGLITKGLKSLAKELGIPIVILSQLSRAVTKKADKRPGLEDLRGSGSIEQDCDLIMFVHRPWYYGIKELPGPEKLSTKLLAEIIIAKHRNGAVLDVFLKFINWLPRFINPEDKISSEHESDDDLPF